MAGGGPPLLPASWALGGVDAGDTSSQSGWGHTCPRLRPTDTSPGTAPSVLATAQRGSTAGPSPRRELSKKEPDQRAQPRSPGQQVAGPDQLGSSPTDGGQRAQETLVLVWGPIEDTGRRGQFRSTRGLGDNAVTLSHLQLDMEPAPGRAGPCTVSLPPYPRAHSGPRRPLLPLSPAPCQAWGTQPMASGRQWPRPQGDVCCPAGLRQRLCSCPSSCPLPRPHNGGAPKPGDSEVDPEVG